MFLNHVQQFDRRPAEAVQIVHPAGLFAGTRVETTEGWRDVSALRAGDTLFTAEGGTQQVIGLRSDTAQESAVRLPATAFGNDAVVFLPADQLVMVETGAARSYVSAPVALVRAQDLVGINGARMRRAPSGRIFTPVLREEDSVWAASGLRLFMPGRDSHLGPAHMPVMSRDEARFAFGLAGL